MIKKWTSSTHAVSDIRDWNTQGNLILQPDYQRREVWSDASKMMLVDSILNGIPMPKIFVATSIKDDKTVRSVIDGQQRITTILTFLEDGFALAAPYQGPYLNKKFTGFPQEAREIFLSYEIDFNQARGLSDKDLREVYSRVNRYIVPLNKQELRKADYPGDFLKLAEELANLEFFDESGVFNAAARRRSTDVEYVCELLAGILVGITDKKNAIDDCCLKYQEWQEPGKEQTSNIFISVIKDIENLFSEARQLRKTRWKQKADFYALFFAIRDLRAEGHNLPNTPTALRTDLTLLEEHIAPSSDIALLRTYALYCVSQANSASSRRWRIMFLTAILRGTYAKSISDLVQPVILMQLAWEMLDSDEVLVRGENLWPSWDVTSESSGFNLQQLTRDALVLAWPANTEHFQLCNAKMFHESKSVDISESNKIHGAVLSKIENQLATLDLDRLDD
jgi:Protein of unknown function DUF262